MSEHKCCVCNRWKSSEYISENYVNDSDTICKKCEEYLEDCVCGELPYNADMEDDNEELR